MKKLPLVLLIAAGLMPVASFAHQAGDVLVRAGFIKVMPHEGSDDVLGLGKFDVSDNTQIGLTASYMITDNIGIELLGATPFKHKVSLGPVGQIAEVKHLPPSLMAQYYFGDAKNSWRPYVGVGINYTTFFDEKFVQGNEDAFSNLKLKDSWGFAAQAGMDYAVNEHMLLNASVWWMDIDTDVRFNSVNASGIVENHNIKTRLDPLGVMLGIGWRF